MDKFQQLVSESRVVIAILGNPAQDSFELLNLEPVSVDRAAEVSKREDFVGLVGIKGLKTQAAFAVELDGAAIQTLSQLFARLMEGAINRVEYWLENDFQNPPKNHTEEN